MNDRPNDYLGWVFWVMWVLANSVAWILGMAVFWILSFILDPLLQGPFNVLGWGAVGALIGTFFGVNHWFLFRPLGNETIGKWAHWWFIATIIGWGIAIAVMVSIGSGEELGFAVLGAIIGISVGIPQWFVLRPYAQRAEWWGLCNTVGWILGLGLIDWIDQAIGFFLAGVVSGAVTGAIMIWFLRNPRPENSDQKNRRSA